MARAGLAIAVVLSGAALLSARERGAMEPTLAVPTAAMDETPIAGRDETIVFAGGCFWGVQAVFEHVRGVKSAVSGYAGGTMRNPSYEDVSTGETGHAESVEVTFDPSTVSLGKLLEIFFSVAHDPTQKNRQGPDVGTQYRSAVFYLSADQQKVTEAYIKQLTAAKTFSRPIVTEVAPLRAFYPAEAYHQHYAMLHQDSPYIYTYDLPKLAALKERFPAMYHEESSTP